MDTYSGKPLPINPKSNEVVPGSTVGPVPVIRVFGTDENGDSVAVHIHGFTPYFYADPPSSDFDDSHCGRYREALEKKVSDSKPKNQDHNQVKTHVLSVSIVRKKSLEGYTGNSLAGKMLQIHMALPSLIATARNILERGFACPGFAERIYRTYESNLPHVLRFMVDRQIVGCNWLELPVGTFATRSREKKETRCKNEYDIVYTNIISHDPSFSERFARLAKLKVLSFDIECMGRRGFFPDATKDPVIQIANHVTRIGSNDPPEKVIFVLGGCTPINGARVVSCAKEEDLLLQWSEFMQKTDPDILTGYNCQNFDMPYLINRAQTLKIDSRFEHLGRVIGVRAKMRKTTFSSSAHGTRESQETHIDGRIMCDVIQYMYRNHKMSSYSLNAVSAEFLGQQKEDVHHSIISDLQRGSDDDRRRLAVYCLKDAYLPTQLLQKLLIVVNYVEMARVTGVPMTFLFSRGQQIKVLSMLHRKAQQHNLVIPHKKREDGMAVGDDDVGYEGATVLEPKTGFYQLPIATLDFASLYPSIMRAHNLCYTTLLQPEDLSRVPEEDREKSPCGNWFIRERVKKGLLPTILEELLSARSRAKKDMKTATDPFLKDVMNGRQLALKISANSVYGFTGATVGALPCLEISSSTTAYGREMIEATKNAVQEHYTVANGFAADAEVIYGDTDSVMVKFGVQTVKEAMELGLDAAQRISKIFPAPVSLEFEKVYFPYLLMNKKRYAGLYWTKPDKWDKMDCKGIETVRRDNCQLVRNVIDTCLRKILIDQSVEEAVSYAKSQISALLQNKIDISLLIITKSLSGDAEEYKNKQPHVELAERMRKRDAGSAPVVGDRVPYVIIQGIKDSPIFQRSEDPLYVLENSIPIDTRYYLEQQLSKPLERLFEGVIPNPSSILSGDHTRNVYKATPSNKVGMMKYTVKAITCMGCKASFQPNSNGADTILCENCVPKRTSLYLKHLQTTNEHEVKYGELWSQCQRCQGSLHQDVLCTSGDCPIFYMRKKVQKDLNDALEVLERFSF
jgi:DNA polymerase delta subunit 1